MSKKRKMDDGSEEPSGQKRKHEEVGDGVNEVEQRAQIPMTSRGAKRVKSVRFEDQPIEVPERIPPVPTRDVDEETRTLDHTESDVTESAPRFVPVLSEPDPSSSPHKSPVDPIDEDEWAAFERDLAPLTFDPATNSQTHSRYSHATISAPAVSATDLPKQRPDQAQAETKTRRRDYEAEAQEEREEEQARLQEEFEVMEEMEERVRRLKEMREKLRVRPSAASPVGQEDGLAVEASEAEQGSGIMNSTAEKQKTGKAVQEDEEESDELDDWFS